MAKSTNSYHNNCSSSNYRSTTDLSRPSSVRSASGTNIRASAYVVDAVTTALKGLHYSATNGTGVGSGIPSPPESPPLAAQTCEREQRSNSRPSRSGDSINGNKAGAACKITEECERLFCDDLDVVFRGERRPSFTGSLVIGVQNAINARSDFQHRASTDSGYSTSLGELRPCVSHDSGYGTSLGLGDSRLPDMAMSLSDCDTASTASSGYRSQSQQPQGLVREWIEVWDYIGAARFRGFTATSPTGGKSMMVFFDNDCVGKELKQGLMSLLELAATPMLDCDSLVIAIDRDATAPPEARHLVRDLGWCGFEAVTLEQWTADGLPLTSRRWFFMGVEV